MRRRQFLTQALAGTAAVVTGTVALASTRPTGWTSLYHETPLADPSVACIQAEMERVWREVSKAPQPDILPMEPMPDWWRNNP